MWPLPKWPQKKTLKEQADMEMADATKPSLSIQALIDKAVSARLKNAPKSHKGKGGTKKVSLELSSHDYLSNISSDEWQEGEEIDSHPLPQTGCGIGGFRRGSVGFLPGIGGSERAFPYRRYSSRACFADRQEYPGNHLAQPGG